MQCPHCTKTIFLSKNPEGPSEEDSDISFQKAEIFQKLAPPHYNIISQYKGLIHAKGETFFPKDPSEYGENAYKEVGKHMSLINQVFQKVKEAILQRASKEDILDMLKTPVKLEPGLLIVAPFWKNWIKKANNSDIEAVLTEVASTQQLFDIRRCNDLCYRPGFANQIAKYVDYKTETPQSKTSTIIEFYCSIMSKYSR